MKNLVQPALAAFIICVSCFLAQTRLYAQTNIAGFRDVQIRSDRIVTAWLGYLAASDTSILKDCQHYSIKSPDDDEYHSAVHPVKVSRFSKGSRSAGGPFDRRVLCDQFMHLTMDKPFKPGKRYVLHLDAALIPRDMQRTLQFSLDETPNPGFKLNQAGYSSTVQTKHIYLSSYLGDGQPVDLSSISAFEIVTDESKAVVYEGTVEKVSDCDPQGHDALYRLDISEFTKEGVFYVRIHGLGRSYSFKNGPEAARGIYDVIAQGLYFQRRGTAMVQPYAGQWERSVAHNQVYVTPKNIVHPWSINNTHDFSRAVDPSNPESGDYYVPDGPRKILGGHYDAGDFDTRQTHFMVSQKLMTLYEAIPENFKDGQAFIPECSNGIPDILDEAAWSLLHLEMLQDYFGEIRGEWGAVPPGVESWTHPPQFATTGDGDMLPYYMRKATPYSSLCGAAVFAQAARVFQQSDPEHAAQFLKRAFAAYDYAVRHQHEIWNPENPKILPLAWEDVYDDDKLNTAWCWAAAELYSSTGEKRFWKAFEKRCHHIVPLFKQFPWMAIYPVMSAKQIFPDSELVKQLKTKLLNEANHQVDQMIEIGERGYQASVPCEGVWGFGNPICRQEIFWYAYYLTRIQKYKDAVALNLDFILGMNPSEISWMTGAGTVYPMDPLSINSKFDGVDEPIPGIVIFGPTENWDHPMNPLYPEPEKMGFYRRISDVWNYVEGCEYVVDEQQTNVYVSAGILLK